MIRVGFALDTFDLGGFELACLDLVRGLDATRFEPHLYSFRPGSLLAEAEARGIAVNVWHDKPADDRTWTERDTAARLAYRDGLAEALRRDAIELLVVWGWGDGVESGLRAGIAHIVERLDGPALVARVRDKSACARIVCESEWIRRLVHAQRRILRVNPERLVVIPNGVDLARFDALRDGRAAAREALGLGPQEIAVMSVARLAPEKNLEQLIDAAALLPTLAPAEAARIRVFLVGPDGGSQAALLQRVRAAGLQDVVHFLGARSDIPVILGAADVFCLTSLYEGTPFALLEAMAMGLPVVCTPVGAVPETVDNNGFLVPALDPHALALALVQLASDGSERARLGQRSRALAAGMDVRDMVERYQVLLEEVVAEPARARVA